jgi:hypothetical protein
MTGALFSVRASGPPGELRTHQRPSHPRFGFLRNFGEMALLPEHQDCADSRSNHVELFGLLESRPFGMAKHSERAPWVQEAVLCERVLLESKPTLRIVCRIARVIEDRIDEDELVAAAAAFGPAVQSVRKHDRAALGAALVSGSCSGVARLGTTKPILFLKRSLRWGLLRIRGSGSQCRPCPAQ